MNTLIIFINLIKFRVICITRVLPALVGVTIQRKWVKIKHSVSSHACISCRRKSKQLKNKQKQAKPANNLDDGIEQTEVDGGRREMSLWQCTTWSPLPHKRKCSQQCSPVIEKQKLKRATLSSCTLVRLATGDSPSPTRCRWKGHGENTPALSIKGADTHSNPLVIVSVQAKPRNSERHLLKAPKMCSHGKAYQHCGVPQSLWRNQITFNHKFNLIIFKTSASFLIFSQHASDVSSFI